MRGNLSRQAGLVQASLVFSHGSNSRLSTMAFSWIPGLINTMGSFTNPAANAAVELARIGNGRRQ
jgi:hypothetical protein